MLDIALSFILGVVAGLIVSLLAIYGYIQMAGIGTSNKDPPQAECDTSFAQSIICKQAKLLSEVVRRRYKINMIHAYLSILL